MPQSFPNQKKVLIHRDQRKRDFMQISNDHWMEFNKLYGPYALQLYLYLAKNADNFSLALSQQAAEDQAGICKTTFHKYLNLLIDKGYLVWREGNIYDFYETPHEPKKKDVIERPHEKLSSSPDGLKNSPHDSRSSQEFSKSPRSNKEINNIQKDNKDIEKDTTTSIEQEKVDGTITRGTLNNCPIEYEEKNGIAYFNGFYF